MLRGNLSTRPFYNERLVTLVMVAAGLIVVLLTVFNATQLVSLSSRRSAVRARLEADRSAAARVRASAAAVEHTVDRQTLTQLAGWTHEANQLIDQRTFSWTGLLGLLEQTLPPDVRLVSISPRVEKGTFKVAMTVVARRLDDVSGFIDALYATGAFYDVAPTEQQLREDGTYGALIDASYLAPNPDAPVAQPPAAGEGRP